MAPSQLHSTLRALPPLKPIHFFALNARVSSTRFAKMPTAAFLCGVDPFADVSLRWSEGGIACKVHVRHPLGSSFFPDFAKGDAIELFFDTRDLKTAGFATRFCHHFLLLPAASLRAREITHFRTDDRHPLCAPQAIEVSVEKKRTSYTVHAFFPRTCLHGYDPLSFDRMGFTYCVHSHGQTQDLTASSEDVAIAQHPRLWASVELYPRKLKTWELDKEAP